MSPFRLFPEICMSSFLKILQAAKGISETSEYNFIHGNGKWGIICNGVSFTYATDAVKDLDIEDKAKILRIGFSHPMPEKLIKGFLKGCEKVLVIEEGEPFMEEAVKAFAQEEGLTLPIRGKGDDLFSRLYEFDPAQVRQCIANFSALTTPRLPLPIFPMFLKFPSGRPTSAPDVLTGPPIMR